MQACHTQVCTVARMQRSEALVNSGSSKVVNTTSTKTMKKFSMRRRHEAFRGCANLGQLRVVPDIKQEPGKSRALDEASMREPYAWLAIALPSAACAAARRAIGTR